MTFSGYDIADAADMEIAASKMVQAKYFTAKLTNNVSDYIEDAEEDSEEFKTFHKVKWSKGLKVALRKIFDDIKNGDFEDDESDGI